MNASNAAPKTNSGRHFFAPALHTHAAWAEKAAGQIEDEAQHYLHPAPLWADGHPFGFWACPLPDKMDTHRDLSKDLTENLTRFIADSPLDDAALLARARQGIAIWKNSEIHSFSGHEATHTVLNVPYVLLLDEPQTEHSQALAREMLVFAQTELLNAHVVILSATDGHFSPEDVSDRVSIFPENSNPWPLFENATSVYTMGADLGFLAILADHKPRVFGQPWYGGWGLSRDENPDPTRSKTLTRAQLFAAAMITYPTWVQADGTPCTFERALYAAQARDRAAKEDHQGYIMRGMAPWKRRFLTRYFQPKPPVFAARNAEVAKEKQLGRKNVSWGGPRELPEDAKHVDLFMEDGFLRSRGLGAALIPPLSLVLDDLGIYFDPSRPSRLETLIADRATQTQGPEAHAVEDRARALTAAILAARLTKYNTGQAPAPLPTDRPIILVVGQVEDDASILCGTDEISTNLALLEAARTQNPDAFILFKPHPDVEANLRVGDIQAFEKACDFIARDADPIALIEACDAVWTMTSLLGFEALLRGKPVTCCGTPFYAGWGLTTDLGRVPARRNARPTLATLVHATLIDYPRYFDPKTGAALSPEDAVDWLAQAKPGRAGWSQALLARLLRLRRISGF